MNPLSWLSLGTSLLGSLGKGGLGIFQNSQANKINPQWSQYTTSPFAQQQLATAQNAYNGRMAGAVPEEQSIASNEASTLARTNRGSTDSSQALALAGQAGGQANEAYSNLGIQEAKNKTNLLGNLNQAYGSLINEGDKEYQSKLMKYQLDTQQQGALRNSAFQNIFGSINDIGGALGTAGQQQDQNAFWKKYFSNLT